MHSFGSSLRSRRLEVVGTRKKWAREKVTRESCVSPSRAPVLSFARYFQAPATQATSVLVGSIYTEKHYDRLRQSEWAWAEV